mmetsp:Transcript_3192/g.12836  ORF Transcript_3192/g.12836 Transcript_3192/m.12836 type:complete len:216 (+) Transcript_3192:1483-2130(+)
MSFYATQRILCETPPRDLSVRTRYKSRAKKYLLHERGVRTTIGFFSRHHRQALLIQRLDAGEHGHLLDGAPRLQAAPPDALVERPLAQVHALANLRHLVGQEGLEQHAGDPERLQALVQHRRELLLLGLVLGHAEGLRLGDEQVHLHHERDGGGGGARQLHVFHAARHLVRRLLRQRRPVVPGKHDALAAIGFGNLRGHRTPLVVLVHHRRRAAE